MYLASSTWHGALLKDCYDVLLPVITLIVNLSLNNATVPMKLKEAAITPIIKKESLDHELYPSFNIGLFLIPDLNPELR